MDSPSFTAADLALFRDLDKACKQLDLTPCLIGAGAIRLTAELHWGLRPARMTKDWDFVVRVETWAQFYSLTDRLIRAGGGFAKAAEPHRFLHQAGGTLDVVPYGELENPKGTIQWGDDCSMETSGLHVLDQQYEEQLIEGEALRVASLPALVGLKLLAYAARRPGIIRDIQDVLEVLQMSERSMDEEHVGQEAIERLQAGDVSYSEICSYLIGKEVGSIFADEQCQIMLALLDGVKEPVDRILVDALGQAAFCREPGDSAEETLRAVCLGIRDGSDARS